MNRIIGISVGLALLLAFTAVGVVLADDGESTTEETCRTLIDEADIDPSMDRNTLIPSCVDAVDNHGMDVHAVVDGFAKTDFSITLNRLTNALRGTSNTPTPVIEEDELSSAPPLGPGTAALANNIVIDTPATPPTPTALETGPAACGFDSGEITLPHQSRTNVVNGSFAYSMQGFDFEFTGSTRELSQGQAPPWYQSETLDNHTGHVEPWSGSIFYWTSDLCGNWATWLTAAKAAAEANAVLKARAESRYLLNFSGNVVADGIVIRISSDTYRDDALIGFPGDFTWVHFTAYAKIQGTHLACNRLHDAYRTYAGLMSKPSVCGGHVHNGQIWLSNFKVRVPGAGDRLLWTRAADQSGCPQRSKANFTKLGSTDVVCRPISINESEFVGHTFTYGTGNTTYEITRRIHQFNTDGSVVFEVT